MEAPQHPPAGWYRDPADPQTERYWSGTAWTHQTRPLDAASDAPTWSGAEPDWRQWLRRPWVPIAAAGVGLLLGVILGAGGEERESTVTSTTTVVSERTETTVRTVRRRVRPRRVTVTRTVTRDVGAAAGGGNGSGSGSGGDCDPNYRGACVPPASQGDVDCADVGGPVTVVGSDPHDLDRDGDGDACE